MVIKISFVEWIAELEAAGRTKAQIALDLGTTLTSLYRYLSNDRVPDRTMMARILEQSGNRVDVACFYTTSAGSQENSGAAA